MESLSKHQLILVALLISFVTSLATGIVTVSLLDQAPQGVTRTITQVIQQTVAGAVSPGASSTAAVAIAVDDQVADATAAIVPSVVRLKDGPGGVVVGLGLVVSSDGSLMTDKSLTDKLNQPVAVYADGTAMALAVVRFQIDGSVAFLAPLRPLGREEKPIAFGGQVRLGSTVWSLSGKENYILSQGIVDSLDKSGSSSLTVIRTTIPSPAAMPGAPLFDAYGSVVGMAIDSPSGQETGTFYPAAAAKAGVPR